MNDIDDSHIKIIYGTKIDEPHKCEACDTNKYALRLRDAQLQNCTLHKRARTHKCGGKTDNLERNGNERRHVTICLNCSSSRSSAEWIGGRMVWRLQQSNDHMIYIHIDH